MMKYLRTAEKEDMRCQWLRVMMILPAVALGVWAMIADGVSLVIWGQQAAAAVVFVLLTLLRRSESKLSSFVWTAVLLVLLTLTLFFPAAGGAKRWLDFRIINLNAAMLVLPSLIVLLSSMDCFYPFMLWSAAVLCFQPDFSQSAAFSLSVLPVLWHRRRNVWWAVISLGFLTVFAFVCFRRPTYLEPISYCEGILPMLGRLSPFMRVLGWLALGLIPGFFTVCFIKTRALASLCLAIYYTVTTLFGIAGGYPVPFMGFGLSPIAGYWLAFLFFIE